MTVDRDAPENIVWQGKYVVAKTRGRWEYVSRARGIRAAVIIAIEDGHVLLVEQYRVPLSALPEFVAQRRALGHAVDVRIAMLLASGFIGED